MIKIILLVFLIHVSTLFEGEKVNKSRGKYKWNNLHLTRERQFLKH